MRPFQEFRLWARRAPAPERISASMATVLVIALVVWLLVPGSGPKSTNLAATGGGIGGEAGVGAEANGATGAAGAGAGAAAGGAAAGATGTTGPAGAAAAKTGAAAAEPGDRG